MSQILSVSQTVSNLSQIILDGFESQKSEISLPYCTQSDLDEAYEAAVRVGTQYFYIKSGYRCGTSLGGKRVLMPMYSRLPKNNIDELVAEFDDAALKIIQSAGARKSDDSFVKAAKIKDYFCKNITYDKRAMSNKDGRYDYAYCAYGPIVLKKGVCQGIAAAYSALLQMVGVNCAVVFGQTSGGRRFADGKHAWNIAALKLGSDREVLCHIDITADLGEHLEGQQRYDYFCIPDSVIELDHQWNKANYARCVFDSLSYFSIFKSFDAKSEDELKLILRRELIEKRKRAVYFRCGYLGEFSRVTDLDAHLKRIITDATGWNGYKFKYNLHSPMKSVILEIMSVN